MTSHCDCLAQLRPGATTFYVGYAGPSRPGSDVTDASISQPLFPSFQGDVR